MTESPAEIPTINKELLLLERRRETLDKLMDLRGLESPTNEDIDRAAPAQKKTKLSRRTFLRGALKSAGLLVAATVLSGCNPKDLPPSPIKEQSTPIPGLEAKNQPQVIEVVKGKFKVAPNGRVRTWPRRTNEIDGIEITENILLQEDDNADSIILTNPRLVEGEDFNHSNLWLEGIIYLKKNIGKEYSIQRVYVHEFSVQKAIRSSITTCTGTPNQVEWDLKFALDRLKETKGKEFNYPSCKTNSGENLVFNQVYFVPKKPSKK